VEGLSAEYSNDNGKEVITLAAADLNFKSSRAGPGYLALLVQGKGGSGPYGWDPVLPQGEPAVITATISENGPQRFDLELPERFDSVAIVDSLTPPGRGVISGPAVLLENAGSRLRPYIWIFLLRSPTTAFRYLPEKSSLTVTHDSSQATASVNPGIDGGIEVQLSISKSGYHKAELFLRRSFAQRFVDESVGQIESGTGSFTWKPFKNDFDYIAIFSPGALGSTMHEEQFEKMFGNAGRFFCDGPGIDYSLHLKAHKRLFTDEDTCKLIPVPE
jgi:hypothetical protein